MPRGVVSFPSRTASPAANQHRWLSRSAPWIAWLSLNLVCTAAASAALVSRDVASRAAAGWLARNLAPMGNTVGAAGSVMTCSNDAGDPLFHVVALQPAGFVVVAADDDVEPVLAFSSRSDFLTRPGTPLFDLLQRDVRTRLAATRRRGHIATASPSARPTAIEARWRQLLAAGDPAAGGGGRALGIADVSDVRIAPLVNSRWDQVSTRVPSSPPQELFIYNFFTPPYRPGSAYNYPAGCAPVAWAQIMRFHEWPKTIGAAGYPIGIDGYGFWETMMGGDGSGGPYDWANMPLEPDASVTPEQVVAIGALMHDAGVGTSVHYTYMGTFGSTTPAEIKDVFHYAEAKNIVPQDGLHEVMKAVQTSLDARLPANVDIFSESGIGHSIVIDGYGYHAGTLYHHLNLGWGGHSTAWYNFPPVDVILGDGSPEFFTIVTDVKYNIDPLVAGEMITGRITSEEGHPIEGATITVNSVPARSVTSDSQGIYALKGLAPNVAYTLSVAADGYLMASDQANVTTGNSAVEIYTTPNRIVDFRASAVTVAVSSPEGLAEGATVVLSVPANAAPPIGWRRNGSPLANTAGFSLSISHLQPAHAGLYALALNREGESIESGMAILGVEASTKIVGTGREVLSNAYVASNGNTFDQVLLEGIAACITADHAENQITRLSYIDLDDDIVQVEFSGPGTLTLTLDDATGPALPVNYAQDVTYMKGHASLVIVGATQDSHVSVFSVGKATAANQALFKPGTSYDGIADLAFIAIASRDGKFGGVRVANANFFAARGVTGLYAPGVEITGPLYVGNITAFDAATPMICVGAATDVRITGGDLYQDNGRPVEVSGLTSVVFRDGTDSHGNLILAKANRGMLRENGVDVTAHLIVTSAPAAIAPSQP